MAELTRGTETSAPHVIRLPTAAGFLDAPFIFTIQYFHPNAEEFKRSALKTAKFETLADGSTYGEIPSCPGVWAKAKNRNSCRRELKQVLSEWVDLKLKDKDRDFPIFGNIDLNAP
jgi:predicted RNase H-like HicB family nuclease